MARHEGWVLAALMSASTAIAAPTVQFDFVGFADTEAMVGCADIAAPIACGAISGSFTFDAAAPDLNPAWASAGLYQAASISLAIEGTPFFSAASGDINVMDGVAVDYYGLQALAGTAANGSFADLSIQLWDFTGGVFASDALVLDPTALVALLPGTFTLFATDGSFQLSGMITAISCSLGCGGGGNVPEPVTWLLVAAGAALAATRRPRSKSRHPS